MMSNFIGLRFIYIQLWRERKRIERKGSAFAQVVGMPDPDFGLALTLVHREGLLFLLGSVVLDHLVALLLEDTLLLLHLLRLVLAPQQVLPAHQRVLQLLLDVDGVALLVRGLRQGILLILGGAPGLVHPRLVKSLRGRLRL